MSPLKITNLIIMTSSEDDLEELLDEVLIGKIIIM